MASTKIHIAFCVIGFTLGLSAFICFAFVYPNLEAASWALLSALKAALTFILHWHYLKESLHANFSRKALQMIGDYAMFNFVAGAGLTLFYLFLEIYYKTDCMPVETSIIIRMVWSFMMTKWALILYISTRKYLRTYSDYQLFSESPNIEEA